MCSPIKEAGSIADAPTYNEVIDIAYSLTSHRNCEFVHLDQITECVMQKYPDWCMKKEAEKFIEEVSMVFAPKFRS